MKPTAVKYPWTLAGVLQETSFWIASALIINLSCGENIFQTDCSAKTYFRGFGKSTQAGTSNRFCLQWGTEEKKKKNH